MNMSQLAIRSSVIGAIGSAVLLLLSGQPCFAQSDANFASYEAEVLGQGSANTTQTTAPGNVRLASAQTTPQLAAPPKSRLPTNITPGEKLPRLNTKELLLKLVAGVVLSVSLCVGIMLVGSKLSAKQPGNRSTKHFEVVDSMMLAQRCWIELVQVKGQFVVVTRDAAGIGNMVALPPNFDEKLEEADKETLEFEKAAEALLAQKGVTGWKQTKQKR